MHALTLKHRLRHPVHVDAIIIRIFMVMARHRASLMLRNQLLPAIMTLKQHQTLLGKLRTSCMRAPGLVSRTSSLRKPLESR